MACPLGRYTCPSSHRPPRTSVFYEVAVNPKLSFMLGYVTLASYPLGRLSNKSRCGPSAKLETLNQLTDLVPSSALGPVGTPRAYRTNSRPVDVGMSSGVSARRPMSCIFARGRGMLVEKERRLEVARGSWRNDCMVGHVSRAVGKLLASGLKRR